LSDCEGIMEILGRFAKDDWAGLHLAANVFVASSVLWLILRNFADVDPIWAISSMVASVDPHVKLAVQNFRARLVNALLGCAVGLVVLIAGAEGAWKLPLALSMTALLSAYIVRVPVMWRQGPITAALIIAAGLEKHSKLTGLEIGLRRVGEVIFGCVVGLLITALMARIWPVPEPAAKDGSGKS
jgi:uncharacterized membrane protein YccC